MHSEPKRPRISGPPSKHHGRRSPPQNEPSRVVFIGDLLANTTERDLYQEMQQYGPVLSVTMMPRNRQALVEFEQLRDAEALIERCKSGRRIFVRDSPALVNYSRSTQINEPRKEYKSASPTSLLLLTLYRQSVDVDDDTFRRIGSPFGRLVRVTVFRGRGVLAVLEFASIEEAARAKPQLNGADMYADCNTVRCEFVTRRAYELLPAEGYELVQDWPPHGAAAADGYGGGRARNGGGGSLLDSGGGAADSYELLARRCSGPDGHRRHYSHREELDYHRDAYYYDSLPPRHHGDSRDGGGRPHYPDNHHRQRQLAPDATAPDLSGCILHLCGLPEAVNCDRLFNLLCLYGNVRRVKFFASQRGQALVEMMDTQSAMLCASFLDDEFLLGSRIVVEISRQCSIRSVREAVNLPDGTPSIKDFDQQRRSLNRFLSEQSAVGKNPLAKPSPVVYFWGFPPHGSETDLRRLLAREGAPDPPQRTAAHQDEAEADGVEFLSADHKSGLLRYDSAAEALAAICLANHAICQLGEERRSWMLKMCFSTRRRGRRWRQQQQEQQQQQQQRRQSSESRGGADNVDESDAVDVEAADAPDEQVVLGGGRCSDDW